MGRSLLRVFKFFFSPHCTYIQVKVSVISAYRESSIVHCTVHMYSKRPSEKGLRDPKTGSGENLTNSQSQGGDPSPST